MVQENWREPLSGKDEEGYIFNLCKDCNFYPCENVYEIVEFATKDSGFQHIDSQIRDGALLKVGEKNEKDGKPIFYVSASKVFVNGRAKKGNSTTSNCEADLLPYNREELQNGCPMGKRYVTQVECGRKRVADGIGNHFKIQIEWNYKISKDTKGIWEPSQPVFISAQTGQGKNYFVEKKLMPYIEKLNYKMITKFKILIISNRLALKCQIHNHIRGRCKEGEEGDSEILYSYNQVADVITYQGLLSKRRYLEYVQKQKQSKYIFVICDESHFFTSDAGFNPYTQRILSTIVNLFRKVIRVYMSATPYECLPQICEYEKGVPVFYHFQRDYSYLNIKTYSEIGELYEEIIKSLKKSEKWLIFIDDKEKCQKVKDELEVMGEKIGISLQDIDSKGGKIYAASADSKKDEIYNLIIHAEKLVGGIQVLITTSVLDNGVNLKNIDNIVVSDMSKVKCLQMVGRARINGPDDRKNLYIKRFDTKYVTSRIRDLKKQREAYHTFDLAYGDLNDPFQSKVNDEYMFLSKYYDEEEKDWKSAKHLFGRLPEEPKKVFINVIARRLMENNISAYENILQEMEEEATETGAFGQEKKLPGQNYLEHQLSWFGKEYCVEDDKTLCGQGKAEKNFLDFLKSFSEKERYIDDGQKEGFKTEFTKLHDAAFPREDKNKDRIYGINLMNKILQKRNLNYKVESKSKCWQVIEVIQDLEEIESE